MYKLLGYNHLSGTSKKSNRPYDFFQLHLATPFDSRRNPGACGDEVFAIACDPQTFAMAGVTPNDIGALFDLAFDRTGRVTALLPNS